MQGAGGDAQALGPFGNRRIIDRLDIDRPVADQNVGNHPALDRVDIIPRFSDAGEPSGTAGKPILQMLEGRDLINVAVGVIRYYGGVNLGTGGLARAYGGTAKMALEAARIITFIEMQELSLSVHYNRVEELMRLVAQLKGKVLDKKFDQAVNIKICLPPAELATFASRFKQENTVTAK